MFGRYVGTPLGALDIPSRPLVGAERRQDRADLSHLAARAHDRAVGSDDRRVDVPAAQPLREFAIGRGDVDNGVAASTADRCVILGGRAVMSAKPLPRT